MRENKTRVANSRGKQCTFPLTWFARRKQTKRLVKKKKKKRSLLGLSWSSGLDFTLPVQRTWVGFLVRKLELNATAKKDPACCN